MIAKLVSQMKDSEIKCIALSLQKHHFKMGHISQFKMQNIETT